MGQSSYIDISKETLEDLYINQNLSQGQVAKVLGCSENTVGNKLKKFGIVKSLELVRDRIKKTNLEKYGVENPSQTDEVKNKVKQTNIKKFGVEFPAQSDDIKNKMKLTMLDRYGVENASQSQEIQEKKRQTTLSNYGVENPFQSSEIKEKIKSINLEKYGVENTSQSEEIQNKIKQTNLDRYGVEYVLQSAEIQEKSKRTNLDKYGVENVAQNEEVKTKIKQTNLDKYGVEYTLKSEEVKNKGVETNLKKYGVKNPMQFSEIQNKVKKTMLDRYGAENPSQVAVIKDKIRRTNLRRGIGNTDWLLATASAEAFQKITSEHGLDTVYKMVKYFGITDSQVRIVIRRFGLTDLYYQPESSLETEIKEFLNSISVRYEKTRNIIKPLELDVYCPDYNIAIEMNGTYWHSSIYKEKKYHINKSKACEAKGIRLIHIYEYEWEDEQSREIIKSMLKSAFGKNDTKIYARNCEVREVSNREVREFINSNHIQGNRDAKVTYGLFHDNELIQIMSFTYMNKHEWWEIIRECTKSGCTVVGGVSKLFKHFIKIHNPDKIFSYCDFNKFNGHGYESLGMKFIGYTGPDMKWIMEDGSVANRNPSHNKYMKEHSIAQIWGAGSKKYLWTKPE